MKRLIIFVLVFWSVGTGVLLAAPSEEEILSQSGADELYELLPEDTQNLLSEKGVESIDANALLDFSFGDLFTMIWEGVANAAGAPIKLFAAGAGLALLCALTAQVGGTLREDSFSGLFHAASVLCASAVIFPIVTDLFQTVSAVLQSAGGFITAFVPVYSAILAASGQPASAALSETALLAAAQIVSAVSSSVLIPLLTVYLALCMVGAVCPDLCMDGITGAAKGIVTVTAGLLMTVFVGLLSLKGSLAGAADSVTLRTAKFAAGAVFPVVGGAVSDALSSVQGSMSLLRSSVGGFASIAIMAMLLPPVLSLLLTQAAMSAASAVARILHADKVAALYQNAASAVSLLCGLTAVSGVLIVVSLGILLRAAGG